MNKNERAYIDALSQLTFSQEAKTRMAKNLASAPPPAKARRHFSLRTVLTAAAAGAALTVTALAAAPGIREAIQTEQGIFAPCAQTIENAACTDQGVEIQILSALSDDVRGQVYFSVRDTRENRLDSQLTLDGELTVGEELPFNGDPPLGFRILNDSSLENIELISYDPNTRTALFTKRFWFGEDYEILQTGNLSAVGMTTKKGRLGGDKESKVSCEAVSAEALESLPAANAGEVILRPSDVLGAPYGDEVLPEVQVVLAPGQNPAPITGTEDIWVSSMGFASDGCFHIRLECAEGVELEEAVLAVVYPGSMDDYGEEHFTILVRRTENGQDILFPMLHSPSQLAEVEFYCCSYARPGTEISGSWTVDFQLDYHASKILDWTGEIAGWQITQMTVSPLTATMNSRGKPGPQREELTAQLKDGSTVTAVPSTSSFNNVGHASGTDCHESYNTWEFEEPIDPENVVSLTLFGETIPVQ